MTTFEGLKSNKARRDAGFHKLQNEKANRSVEEAKKKSTVKYGGIQDPA